MLRIIYAVEKNLAVVPTKPITLAAATSTLVLQDSRQSAEELAVIEISNIGDNDAYYAYGVNKCDPTNNLSGRLVPGQTISVPHRLEVSMYSTDGTTIAFNILKRATGVENTKGISL